MHTGLEGKLADDPALLDIAQPTDDAIQLVQWERKFALNPNTWLEIAQRLEGNPKALPELAPLFKRLHNAREGYPSFFENEHPELYRLWINNPGNSALVNLAMHFEGMHVQTKKPTPWWAKQKRLGKGKKHWYDRESLMPLHVKHKPSGMDMAWIPIGNRDGFYMGIHPVTVAQYDKYERSKRFKTPGPNYKDQLRYHKNPIVGIPLHHCESFARWASGRIPELSEWRAVTTHVKNEIFGASEKLDTFVPMRKGESPFGIDLSAYEIYHVPKAELENGIIHRVNLEFGYFQLSRYDSIETGFRVVNDLSTVLRGSLLLEPKIRR
ncbi:MAG: SUMF1/EgtB/PvdO family nonheme iron enzyme [Candidatus Nanoarchaeia archaeon]